MYISLRPSPLQPLLTTTDALIEMAVTHVEHIRTTLHPGVSNYTDCRKDKLGRQIHHCTPL